MQKVKVTGRLADRAAADGRIRLRCYGLEFVVDVDRKSAAPLRALAIPWMTLAAPSGLLMTYQTRKAIPAHLIYFIMATCAPFARTQLPIVIPQKCDIRPF